MKVDIKVPEVGESITEGVLIQWFVQDGDIVAKDDPLFELETDKITMQVQATEAGRVSIVVPAETDVAIGQVVGSIDTAVRFESGTAEKKGAMDTAVKSHAEQAVVEESRVARESSETQERLPSKPKATDATLSPAVRRLVEEHEIDKNAIEGTGKDGRITKGDVIAFLKRKREKPTAVVRKLNERKDSERRLRAVQPRAADSNPRETRTPMSSLRRRVASRLVQAQQNAAILTTFNEVDMTQVIAWRSRFKETFSRQHGVKLGFMSFFVKAAVEALRAVPQLNARVDGTDIVQNHYYDIAVAIGSPRGLVVPVLRDADQLSFAQIEQRIADLSQRAADGRLELSELQGGSFTISNGGIYGSMLSTPIINPPQSGILGMHAIKKRAVVVGDDDRIEVRPMMYLALSYDHRIVDGREAVTFLRRIAACIEQPERLALEA